MAIPYTTPAKAKEIAKESIKESGVSKVTVSSTGTATDTVQYITIDGVEKKLAGGGSGENPYADILFKESGDTTLINTANENAGLNIHTDATTEATTISLALKEGTEENPYLSGLSFTKKKLSLKAGEMLDEWNRANHSYLDLIYDVEEGGEGQYAALSVEYNIDTGGSFSDISVEPGWAGMYAESTDDAGYWIKAGVITEGELTGCPEFTFTVGDVESQFSDAIAYDFVHNGEYVGTIETVHLLDQDELPLSKHYVGWVVFLSETFSATIPIDIHSSVSPVVSEQSAKETIMNVLIGDYVGPQLIGKVVQGKDSNSANPEGCVITSVENGTITLKSLDNTKTGSVSVTETDITNGQVVELTSGNVFNLAE